MLILIMKPGGFGFTSVEQRMLRELSEQGYGYLARDENGDLYAFDYEPRLESPEEDWFDYYYFSSPNPEDRITNISPFKNMFKSITFKNSPYKIESIG